MEDMRVRLTFLEGLLGTCPANEELYRDFIATKAPDPSTVEDEVAALGVDEVVEKGKTIFPRTPEDVPFLYDYQIKGFFKAAAQALKQVPKTKSAGIKAYKKKIDTLIFPGPRCIPLEFEGEIGICQRPRRVSGPAGERVNLAISEEIPAGASCEFTVTCLVDEDMDLVREWLDYGRFSGLGQWRNSGRGRFSWEELS